MCNYSRILRSEGRKERWSHESHQRVEGIVVLELGRFNDRGQRRMRLRPPF